MRVLLIKMSSLGDVIHTLPAVSDAAAHGVRFDWVVEEAFADIPARHSAVDRVLPIAWRRWRRNLRRHRPELRAFLSRLRERRYDLILDAQGLIKSAAVTALARGPHKAGLSRASAREAAAALFYDRPVEVARDQHAIVRLRQLFAGALDYPTPAPDAPLDYGIAAAGPGPSDPPICALLHGTTWDSKHWPLAFWQDLAGLARDHGFRLALPAGNDAELARSLTIAGGPLAGDQARIWNRVPLSDLIEGLGRCRLAVGVDSGLSHLAAALSVPTIVLYGSTSSRLTGCRGAAVGNLQARFPCAPCLDRTCGYGGEPVVWKGREVVPPCFSDLPPERVWHQALELLNADRPLHL